MANINDIIDAAKAAYWEASNAHREKFYKNSHEQMKIAMALGKQAEAVVYLQKAETAMREAAPAFSYQIKE